MNSGFFETLKEKKIVIIIAFSFIFFLILLSIYLLSYKKNNNVGQLQGNLGQVANSNSATSKNKEIPSLRLSYGIVYGVWADNASIIRGIDLTQDRKYELASLPSNIKKVVVLPPTQLIYIDDTDDHDYGSRITSFDLNNKQKKIIYKADEGFGIDDYVISANQKYLAVWEVKLAPNSAILRGGSSRIYSFDITVPNVKHLIYDEVQKEEFPIRYPRGITNNGDVFTDMFLPNTATGWGYGMSRSDFLGNKKEDIRLMRNGTYGTQPSFSTDKQIFAFAGYNGVYGPGMDIKNEFKQADLTPNTLEIYDPAKNTREKLLDLGKEGIIKGVSWDRFSGKIAFSTISKDEGKDGAFVFDLDTKKMAKINFSQTSVDSSLVSFLPSGSLLIGNKDSSDTTIGNLGDSYAFFDTKYSIVDSSGYSYSLKSSDSFMQFISIVPSSVFKNKAEVLGATSSQDSRSALQLEAFYFKTELAPKRVSQQTKPRCDDLAKEQCLAMGFTSQYTNDPNNYEKCFIKQRLYDFHATGADGKLICDSSPLYLYGDNNKKVNVKINTNIFSSNADNSNGNYQIEILNGKMKIGQEIYDSLDYNYTPGIKNIFPPSSGEVVSADKIQDSILKFAKNLNLNKKETDDLLNWSKNKVNSPFAFVSFYDQKTSEKILPISFDPVPDTYINIVFYIKPLNKKPSLTIPYPSFNALNRKGFTAVEISGIVDY